MRVLNPVQSQRPGANCRVACKFMSGIQECAGRLKEFVLEAKRETAKAKQRLELLGKNRHEPSFFSPSKPQACWFVPLTHSVGLSSSVNTFSHP